MLVDGSGGMNLGVGDGAVCPGSVGAPDVRSSSDRTRPDDAIGLETSMGF
jgi:hypothetical protein